jgi:formylglycine-generating enzyme required for sulfatase activity
MGSPRDESGRNDDEQPHLVQLTRGFAMGRTEVTRAQYRHVVGELPPGVGPEPGALPVDQVTPEEADVFCQRLGQLDGRHYRLPTEAEWEYACRSGTLGPFGWRSDRFGDAGWYAANSGGTLHPVGAKVPNHWGLFDMQGNAAELTADRYVPYLGSADRVDPAFRTGGRIYAVRGGTASSPAEDCRAASRSWVQAGTRKATVGFRVVADAAGTVGDGR